MSWFIGGFLNNYLMLGELEKSQEYFQKAEAIANGYEDTDMLAIVDSSWAYDLVKHRSIEDEVVTWWQPAIYVSPNSVNQIERGLKLAHSDMHSFLEESVINDSLRID